MNSKVLIVEDDPALQRGLKDNFVEAGHHVRVARDGEEGLRMAMELHPDLIILDIMLPEMKRIPRLSRSSTKRNLHTNPNPDCERSRRRYRAGT